MKPFNLEAAKRGEPVQTRMGRPVRILCFDRKGELPIIGLITRAVDNEEEFVWCWNYDGSGSAVINCDLDLFMAPKKQEGWVNVPQSGRPFSAIVYQTKEMADACSSTERIACVRIEWEEKR